MTSSIQPPPFPKKEERPHTEVDMTTERIYEQCPTCPAKKWVGYSCAHCAHKQKLIPNVAVKHDQDKPTPQYIPTDVLLEYSKVMAYGAKKYAPFNYLHGFTWSRLVGGLFRHLFAWVAGERKDPETGLSHLSHAGCMLLMLSVHELRSLGTDDMPKGKATKE